MQWTKIIRDGTLIEKDVWQFLSIVFDLERTNQLNLLPDKDLVDLCHPIEPYQVTKNPPIIGSIVISPQGAVSLLGTMVGGYNVHSLILWLNCWNPALLSILLLNPSFWGVEPPKPPVGVGPFHSPIRISKVKAIAIR